MPELLIFLFVSFAAGYVLLLLLCRAGWFLTAPFQAAHGAGELPSVSVIVPARNEAGNIGACLTALTKQNYPQQLLEILVVDDASEDETAAIAAAFPGVKVIRLPQQEGMVAYKKRALSAGIAAGSGALIVTTDADCVAGQDWLRTMACFQQQTGAHMVAAPVVFAKGKGLVSVFQSLDFMTMQGVTAAVLKFRLGSMANGANLLFTRAAFERVNGYEGATHLASGDDYLLMNKLRLTYRQGLYYLKARAAIVTTMPQPDWPSFFSQRVRWASKSGKYKDGGVTAMLLLVYFFNLMLFVFFAAGFWVAAAWQFLGAALIFKLFGELVLLLPVARFFQRGSLLWWFPLLQPLHILYIIAAGFFGMLGGYSWKGRKVR